MLLEQNFYYINEFDYSENVIMAKISFNPKHEIFNGHFPNQPIVPGVCMVQIIKELAGKALGKEYKLVQGSQMKFLKLIDPTNTQSVLVNIALKQQENNTLVVNTTFSDTSGTVLKLTNGVLSDR